MVPLRKANHNRKRSRADRFESNFNRIATTLGFATGLAYVIGKWTKHPLTYFPWVLCVALIVAVSALGIKEFRRHKSYNFLFISGHHSEAEPFYNRLILEIMRIAVSKPGKPILITPFIASRERTGNATYHLSDAVRIQKLNRQFDGCFIVMGNPGEEKKAIPSVMSAFGSVVLVDVDIAINRPNNSPPFVGGNENLGGAIAGLMAAWYLDSQPEMTDPMVRILVGSENEWDMRRVLSFEEAFCQNSSFNRRHLSHFSKVLHYQQDVAFEYLVREWKEEASRSPDHLIRADLIFAANDDMALGAITAIEAVRGAGLSFLRAPRVLGYDGQPSMMRLIENNHESVLGTIDVNIMQIAEDALEVLLNVVQGSHDETGEARIYSEPSGVSHVIPQEVLDGFLDRATSQNHPSGVR